MTSKRRNDTSLRRRIEPSHVLKAIGLDVYRIRLDGTGLQRLSEAAGNHSATFSPRLTHYADKWSDIRTPDQARVHRNDGRLAHVVEANVVAHDYDLLLHDALKPPGASAN